MLPKISIIIPSYNEEKNISRCLDSVLNQTFTDFEILCVDDSSSDNTFEIIKNYSNKDSRIVPLKNPKKGVSSARNFGIENAKGEYIGFVDSDDFIQPQMFEFLYKAVTENNCDFSVCRYNKTSELKINHFDYKTEDFKPENFININDNDFTSKNELIFSAIWTKLISKNFLGEIRFEDYKIGEDTVFNARLCSKNYKAVFVDAELYNYYINTESVSFTKLWDKKWFDLLQTRFISYDILKNKNSVLSQFYLERGMKFLLSYRFIIKDTPNINKFYKPIKEYFKKYFVPFMKCKNISIKNKITIPIFFLIPPLYTAFRKMTDKTL